VREDKYDGKLRNTIAFVVDEFPSSTDFIAPPISEDNLTSQIGRVELRYFFLNIQRTFLEELFRKNSSSLYKN